MKGDTTKFLVYIVNVKAQGINLGRSRESFNEAYSKMEFREASSGKLGISLSKFFILKTKLNMWRRHSGDDISKLTQHNVMCIESYSSHKVEY